MVVDEAHRSIYSKYKGIFQYFDSYLVGLTATPKDEVDRNTYSLFQRENQDPTFAFGLEEAIDQGYLVPPKSVSVPLNIVREGLVYDELSEDELSEDSDDEFIGKGGGENEYSDNESLLSISDLSDNLSDDGEGVIGGDGEDEIHREGVIGDGDRNDGDIHDGGIDADIDSDIDGDIDDDIDDDIDGDIDSDGSVNDD